MKLPSASATNLEILEALYRGVLGREPDASVHAMEAQLANGEITLDLLVKAFVDSEEFRGVPRFTNDQSQYGEIEHLLRLMVNGDQPRTVVDVGARGMERSNAYDLMKTFGWRGLLVEANPNLIQTIRRDFSDLDMTLINCAVSDFDGTAAFHFGVNDDVSSLNRSAAESWGAVRGETTVDVRRLPSLLRENGVSETFDLLSIDIEGEDIKVLNDTIGEGFRPRFVIIEACYDYTVSSLYDLPFSEEVRSFYRIVERTPANLILMAA